MEKKETKTLSWPKTEVKYNPDLDKYEGRTLFPEKLAKANEMLRTIGIPEDFRHKPEDKICK